jgi:Resolvase, N terminal domain/Recombinase
MRCWANWFVTSTGQHCYRGSIMRKPEIDRWKGKRFIGLARQSDNKDGNASTESQLVHMRRECDAVGMTETDVIPLKGVTGSLPGRRKDLIDLLKRKREKNDFDVIAVHVVDRLTRGGTKHGFWFEHECDLAGVELFFVGENIPSGPYSSIVRATMYEAAHEASVATGRRSTDGQTSAIKKGMFRTAGQTPMGCFRLYFDGSNGQPKFYIRNLLNGLQEQYEYETHKIIGNFGTLITEEEPKSQSRFKKQRNEFSLLIPGDTEEQRTIRLIFFLRYSRGWRGSRIADFLNRNGRPAPCGGTWSPRQVESAYENECYTGLDVKGRVFSGRFYRRDEELGYVDLERTENEMATATYFRPVLLPREKWMEDDQPHMKEFLPTHIRDLAIREHELLWTKRLDPLKPERTYNAHPASDYLLSNILMAQQDGEPLVGTLSGPKDSPKTAYYRHNRAKREKLKGSIFANLIRADVLHDALIALVKEVLLDAPALRERLVEYVKRQRSERPVEEGSLVSLEAERDEIAQQIGLIIRCLKGAARKDAEAELESLGRRRNEIEGQINWHRDHHDDQTIDSPEVVADRIVTALRDTAIGLHKLAPEAVSQLVHEMVASATVDMATKAVSFGLVLPKRILDAKNKGERMCPITSSRSSTGGWTHAPIAVAECEYQFSRGSTTVPPCYVCRRRAA